jgi:hypothetical protein
MVVRLAGFGEAPNGGAMKGLTSHLHAVGGHGSVSLTNKSPVVRPVPHGER